MDGTSRIGIDLGGTNIKAVLVDAEGNILRRAQVGTPKADADAIAQTINSLADALDFAQTLPMGVTCPGEIRNGIVSADNLQWRSIPFEEMLRRGTRRPLTLCQDGHAAMKAEWAHGALMGYQNAVFVAIGTGIGGDVILGGHSLRMLHPSSCEIGHMITHTNGKKCLCGNRGCFEKYASASALNALAESIGADAPTLCAWAKEGRTEAKKLWQKYIHELGVGILSVISLYAPEVVCIGGGICAVGDFLTESIHAELKKSPCYCQYYADTRIALSRYGTWAGAFGAAMVAKEMAV